MTKRFVVAALAVFALAWARPSAADTVTFDYNGALAGGVVDATAFDWKPGNSLLVEGAVVDGVQTGQIFYQANLNQILTTSGAIADGTDGVYYTAVAVFDVTISGTGFSVVSGSGTFNIYADAEGGNDLTGVGFANDAGSTLVLSGYAATGTGGLVLLDQVVALDQFNSELNSPEYGGLQPGGDNYPTVDSLVSAFGGFNITVAVDYTNPLYFLSNPSAILVSMVNSGDNKLPYNSVNPSAMFSSDAVADANRLGVGAVGPVNGACIDPQVGTPGSLVPCTIMAQSDANTTFTAVPEPASLTLLGLGLAGSAAARRRMQKKAKQQA